MRLREVLGIALIVGVVTLSAFQNCARPSNVAVNASDDGANAASATSVTTPSAIPQPNSQSTPTTCNDLTSEDPYFCAVVLLMHMDGANDSTTFTDSGANKIGTATANGAPVISTDESIFGGASLYLNGNSYLTFADSANWNLSTIDSTIEAWIFPTASQISAIVSQSPRTLDEQWLVAFEPNFFFVQKNGGQQNLETSSGPSLNTWTHLAVSHKGQTTMIFVNGVLVQSGNTSPYTNNTTDPLYIGAVNTIAGDGSSHLFKGYIDELRITAGIARYTANFNPPTTPFPSF